MYIDFSKIGKISSIDKILHPREIFMALPEKAKKYEYPRDVQTEVWNQWFEMRDNKDNMIKMNTGGGKTVVGLLILKSCLNEGKGPAVYVAPDSYLVCQVSNEAKALGLEITENENDPSYLRGKSILIINIYKLINGKSVFGMRESGLNVQIGSILIDDVHACLNITESQFTIEISRNNSKYNEIYNIFVNDLKQQNESKVDDIKKNIRYTNMLVPYWAWHNKYTDVIKILNDGRDDEDIEFKWPLLRDCLELCNCVISSEKIEISPKSIPINKISSFNNANRRIFMSATLSDDSTLVSHFNIDINSIKRIITPEKADDLGDRLIVFPQVISPDIDDDDIKSRLKELSQNYNVVVIVPSIYRASYWYDVADIVLNSSNLYDGVQRLKSEHVGLAILINKYDGIDLPDDACRVLVIDGLPDVRREYDKIEQTSLQNSERLINDLVQRVEQGMGRGVRSYFDYCVIFLMGKRLSNALYGEGALNKFSIATRAQLKFSEDITSQAKGKSIDEIFSIIDYLLKRDKQWVTASKSILHGVKYDRSIVINSVILAYRKAFDYAEKRDYRSSIKCMNDLICSLDSGLLRGWLKQHLAEYMNFIDPVESQKILKSALRDNISLLKPIEGIQYDKNLKKYSGQGLHFIEYANKYKLNENKYILKINDLLDKLAFKPDTADIFEQAFCDIAEAIGFYARRPEKEVGKGPDVLWRVDQLKFYVIECKNGVTNNKISKSDCNQLNGSIIWFKTQYDKDSCECVPIMIHPSTVFEYVCSPDENVRIIDNERLNLLKENIKKFSKAVVELDNFSNSQKINVLLKEYKLTSGLFISTYTTGYTLEKRT